MARKVLFSLKSLLRDAQRRGNVAQNVALPVKIKANSRDKRKLEIGVDIPSRDEIKAIFCAGRQITAAIADRDLRWFAFI